MDSDEPGVDVGLIVAALRRRAPVIVLCVVLAAAVALVVSKIEHKQYTATTSLLFSNTQLAEEVAGITAAPSVSTQQSEQDTDVGLAEIGDMAAKTARRLGDGLTKRKVMDDISIAAKSDTNLVEVSATASSPQLAAAIANTYSGIFVAEQETAGHAYYAAALATVNKQLADLSPSARTGSQGLALQERASSLATLTELPTGAVSVAAAATLPTGPSSPKLARNTLGGALLGLLLGLALVFWLERSDQRLRDPKELEASYGRPLLGVIPESAALARTRRRAQTAEANGRPASASAAVAGASEAFQLIRGHLRYFNVDRELRTLLVVSASPGDGKTTLSVNLALAAAQTGANVLLIDADLRRPSVATHFALPTATGLVDALIGAVTIREAIQTLALDPPLSSAGTRARPRSLSVMVAGATPPPNPTELLESHAMESLLKECGAAYDLVVIDSSPLLAVPDVLAMLGEVDGVIVVGRLGHHRRDESKRLRQVLESTNSPVIGVVANGLKSRRGGAYGYAYVSE